MKSSLIYLSNINKKNNDKTIDYKSSRIKKNWGFLQSETLLSPLQCPLFKFSKVCMSLHKEEYTLKIKRWDKMSLDKNYDTIKFYKDSVWQQPQMDCALKMYTLFLSLGIFNSSYSLPVFKKQCICTYRWVTHILPTQVRHRQPNKNNHLLKTQKMAIVCLII